MSPFVYAKTPHRRRLNPGPYLDYRTYKPHLRDEFGKKCIYCRMPDGHKGVEGFGVEHYKPKKRFPSLECVYVNLFYCCNCCNSRKGNFWPDPDDNRAKRFVPNPCDHTMFDHLRYSGPRIEGKTAAGRHTIRLLDLDAPEAEMAREAILSIIDSLLTARAKAEKTVEGFKKLKATPGEHSPDAIDSALAYATAELDRVNRALSLYI